MTNAKFTVILWGLIACGAFSQPAPAPLSFEVASIKPAAPDAPGMFIQIQPGGGLRVSNMNLKQLISYAYDVRDFQVSGGPGWVNSDRFDIQARPAHAGDAPTSADDFRNQTDAQRKTMADQMRERTRTLLADRFQLVVRRETKEAPVYALQIAKGGPKLKEDNEPQGRQGIMARRRGQFTGTAAPLQMLATVLSGQLGRPVIDKTGLAGKYDFELEWSPDPGQNFGPAGFPPGAAAPPPTDPNGPTLFTALQEQLGLRLESGKGPIEMILIDRIEKPSEN